MIESVHRANACRNFVWTIPSLYLTPCQICEAMELTLLTSLLCFVSSSLCSNVNVDVNAARVCGCACECLPFLVFVSGNDSNFSANMVLAALEDMQQELELLHAEMERVEDNAKGRLRQAVHTSWNTKSSLTFALDNCQDQLSDARKIIDDGDRVRSSTRPLCSPYRLPPPASFLGFPPRTSKPRVGRRSARSRVYRTRVRVESHQELEAILKPLRVAGADKQALETAREAVMLMLEKTDGKATVFPLLPFLIASRGMLTHKPINDLKLCVV